MTIAYEDSTQYNLQKPSTRISSIRWNAEQYSITIKDMRVTFTPTEYRLLFSLQHGTPVTYVHLAPKVYYCALNTTTRKKMDKLVDRIRGKLQGTGISVYCVFNYGYILLDEIISEEAESA